MSEPATPAPDWSATSLKASELPKLIDQYEDARSRVKAFQEQVEVLALQIRHLLEKHKLESVRCGRYQPRIYTSHKPKKLSADKLLELGVRQSVISKAWVGGEEYQTFRIFDVGEGE